MIKLEQVWPQELTEQDIRWLIIGCAACNWKVHTAERLVQRALEGIVGFYRFVGEGEGMVAVSKEEDELFIEAVAGKNLLRNFAEVHEQLATLARAVGLSALSGMVSRPGLRRLYETQTKARAVAVQYTERLK